MLARRDSGRYALRGSLAQLSLGIGRAGVESPPPTGGGGGGGGGGGKRAFLQHILGDPIRGLAGVAVTVAEGTGQ